MGNPGWKQFERRIARDHGVERQPVTGERDGSDVKEHARYVISCKVRQEIPKTVRTWADSIARCGKYYGKVPVLVMKAPHQRDDTALVVLRYADWIAMQAQLVNGDGCVPPQPMPVLEPAQPVVVVDGETV